MRSARIIFGLAEVVGKRTQSLPEFAGKDAKAAIRGGANLEQKLRAYESAYAGVRAVQQKVLHLEQDISHKEYELAGKKSANPQALEADVKKAKEDRAQALQQVLQYGASTFDTAIYEELFQQLASSNDPEAWEVAQQLGLDMNWIKIHSSSKVLQALRTIYFGDKPTDNSDLFFRLIERPDQTVFVYGEPEKIRASLQETVNSAAVKRFDGIEVQPLVATPESLKSQQLQAQLKAKKSK
eukprot:TRINITY_DN2074_c0_g1_i1.p1 TRINITY_DN2074_c0_g1~~TRINITY_DN2074_c0_g1_i1.p1  ORF type:complete len:240 (+),score=68.22 TRINITY_DN2074_c0_g1_i1:281-1000(+)